MFLMNPYTFIFSPNFAHQFKLSSAHVINVQVLELEKCGVQLEQCQLVRYNEKSGTLGNPFDKPKVGIDLQSVCVCVCVCVCV